MTTRDGVGSGSGIGARQCGARSEGGGRLEETRIEAVLETGARLEGAKVLLRQCMRDSMVPLSPSTLGPAIMTETMSLIVAVDAEERVVAAAVALRGNHTHPRNSFLASVLAAPIDLGSNGATTFSANDGLILNVSVSEDFRKRGIGKALLMRAHEMLVAESRRVFALVGGPEVAVDEQMRMLIPRPEDVIHPHWDKLFIRFLTQCGFSQIGHATGYRDRLTGIYNMKSK